MKYAICLGQELFHASFLYAIKNLKQMAFDSDEKDKNIACGQAGIQVFEPYLFL